ncbi:MAG: hypothetical protein IPG07_19140 [Crocinitomicaceae bacterium]|nr:hypothetical protein [Crocinitomicaceae bacterium]
MYKLVDNVLLRYFIYAGDQVILNHLNIAMDSAQNIWIGDYNFGVIKYANSEFYHFPEWSKNGNTLSFHVDAGIDKNGVWSSSDKGFLSRFDKDSIFQYQVTHHDVPVKIFGSACCTDTNFFISNVGLVFETRNNFYKIEIEGVEDDQVLQSIAKDSVNGSIYFTSFSELFILTKEHSVIEFNTYNDLFPVTFKRNSIVVDDGTLNFGTSGGLINYIPFEFRNQNKARKLIIDDVNVSSENQGELSLRDVDAVSYDSVVNSVYYGLKIPLEFNSIKLNVSCINWGKEIGIKYWFKLDNSKWNTFDGDLEFANLSVGTHKLIVKADLTGKVSANDLVLEFEIFAPFYLTAWFLFSVLFIFIVGVWIMITRFSGLSFSSFNSNTDISFLLKKSRVIAVSAIIMLLIIDSYHSLVNDAYEVNWSVNITAIALSVFIIYYTYLRNPNPKLLAIVVSISFWIVSF